MQQDKNEGGGEIKQMTFEDASQIYYINKEIGKLYKELADLKQQSFIKPISISDMPRGGSTRDLFIEYTNSTLEIEDMIRYSLMKLQRERKKIEQFLNTIQDSELRLIMRLRCVNNMGWKEIGEEVGCERTTASKKFYRYFNDQNISHISH